MNLDWTEKLDNTKRLQNIKTSGKSVKTIKYSIIGIQRLGSRKQVQIRGKEKKGYKIILYKKVVTRKKILKNQKECNMNFFFFNE